MTNVNANKLSVWYYDTAEVRTMMIENEPWWVLTDVCKALGHSNSRMVTQRLEEDDVTEAYIIDALGRKQAVTLVNESGLYEAIFRSNIPSAKEFRHCVTHEVLPALRKNGYYEMPNNSSNNGDNNSANKRRHIWECLKRYDLRHRND